MILMDLEEMSLVVVVVVVTPVVLMVEVETTVVISVLGRVVGGKETLFG